MSLIRSSRGRRVTHEQREPCSADQQLREAQGQRRERQGGQSVLTSKSSSHDAVEGKVAVGVGHEDAVVCRTERRVSSAQEKVSAESVLLAPRLACTRFPLAPAVS